MEVFPIEQRNEVLARFNELGPQPDGLEKRMRA